MTENNFLKKLFLKTHNGIYALLSVTDFVTDVSYSQQRILSFQVAWYQIVLSYICLKYTYFDHKTQSCWAWTDW